jgi:hypothetical protein
VSKRLSFFPLRDASGTTQLALHAAADGALATLSASPVESAVLVEGEVRLRPEGQRRPVRAPFFLSTAPVFIPAPGSRREHRGARRCRDAPERCGTAAALLRV